MERRKVTGTVDRDLEVLYEVIDLFTGQFTREEELAIIIDALYKQPYAQSCGILLRDKTKRAYSFAVSRGLSKKFLAAFARKRSFAQLEKIGKSTSVIILDGADRSGGRMLKFEKEYGTMVLLPLKSEGDLVGLMFIESRPGHAFGLKEANVLNTFAVLAAISLTREGLVKKTHELEVVDDLTALYDMGYFRKRLEIEFKRAAQHREKLSLMIVNIGGYDDYLAAHGQKKADAALVEVAALLRNNLRTIDILGRYSMNQIVASLYNCSSRDCRQVAERVVRGMGRIKLRPARPALELAVGIAGSSSRSITSTDDLLDCTEEAVFDAFSTGAGTVKVYSARK